MPDYTMNTGSTGIMMIRDTGTNIQFWLYAALPTVNHNLPWSYRLGAEASGQRYFDFSGGGWRRLSDWPAPNTITVVFAIQDSGTSGLGGPTRFEKTIYRDAAPAPTPTPTPSPTSGVPDPPPWVNTARPTETSIDVGYAFGLSNGDPINQNQVGYSLGSDAPDYITNVGMDTSVTIGALASGRRWYFWVRSGNRNGWSNWSGRAEGLTASPYTPPAPTPTPTPTTTVPGAPPWIAAENPTDSSIYVRFGEATNGGAAITGRQIGYGTDPTSPIWITDVGPECAMTIGLLASNRTWYFWARESNYNGWGNWSYRTQADTLKGLLVPTPPGVVVLTNPTQTSVVASFRGSADDGGATIVEYQIGYGLDQWGPSNFVSSGGTSTLTNLSPGKTYYFWARARNSVGWSDWGPISSISLRAGAFVFSGYQARPAVPYVIVNGSPRLAEAWVRYGGVWRKL